MSTEKTKSCAQCYGFDWVSGMCLRQRSERFMTTVSIKGTCSSGDKVGA